MSGLLKITLSRESAKGFKVGSNISMGEAPDKIIFTIVAIRTTGKKVVLECDQLSLKLSDRLTWGLGTPWAGQSGIVIATSNSIKRKNKKPPASPRA